MSNAEPIVKEEKTEKPKQRHRLLVSPKELGLTARIKKALIEQGVTESELDIDNLKRLLSIEQKSDSKRKERLQERIDRINTHQKAIESDLSKKSFFNWLRKGKISFYNQQKKDNDKLLKLFYLLHDEFDEIVTTYDYETPISPKRSSRIATLIQEINTTIDFFCQKVQDSSASNTFKIESKMNLKIIKKISTLIKKEGIEFHNDYQLKMNPITLNWLIKFVNQIELYLISLKELNIKTLDNKLI
jgi:hypothetical protein